MTVETLDIILREFGFAEGRAEINLTGDSIRRMGDEQLWLGRQSERSFGLMTKGFRGMAGLFGVTGAAFGLKDLIEAGMSLQQNQLMLQRALKGTGDAGKAAFDKIDEAAVKSSEHGGFSRDEELRSLTQLINTAKKVPGAVNPVNIAMRANQAAVNLSREENISYAESQHYMAMAMAGQVNRLRQYIGYILPVKTAEQQLVNQHKELEAQLSNDKISASSKRQLEIQYQITKQQQDQAVMQDKLATGQEVINRLLTAKSFAGAQAAFSKTTAGQLSNLKNSLQEVMGTIGEGVLPVVNSVSHALSGAMQLMVKLRPVTIGLAAAVTALGVVAFGKMLHHGVEYFIDDMRVSISKFTNYERQYTLNGLKIVKTDADQVGSLKAVGKLMSENSERATILAEKEKLLAEVTQNATRAFMVDADGQMREAKQYEINFGHAMNYTEALQKQKAVQMELMASTEEQIAVMKGQIASDAEAAGATGELTVMMRAQAVASGIADVATTGLSMGVDMLAAAINMIPGILIFTAITMAMMHMGLIVSVLKHAFTDVWSFISGHWKLLIGIFAGPLAPLVLMIHHFKQIIGLAKQVGSAIGHFFGGVGHFIGSIFNEGGVVHKAPKYLATGGPIGTDTVPAWLTPGEGILSRQAMNMIGERGLNMLNMGQSPFGGQSIMIQPGVVNVQIDAKTIARAIVQYTLSKAARGPSSLVGGALVTGT